MIGEPEIIEHGDRDDGRAWPALVWQFAEPVRTAATAVLGGGLGDRLWVINAQVAKRYYREPVDHLMTIAAGVRLDAAVGVGLLTAARVLDVAIAINNEAECAATVGLSMPVWAAAPDDCRSDITVADGTHDYPAVPDDTTVDVVPQRRCDTRDRSHQYAVTADNAERGSRGWTPGTINLVCWVPAPLCDAALVNAVVTATEAKTQALLDAGMRATGTASDAVVVCTPRSGIEPYCGPRSTWGARLARAVYAAVADGTARCLG